MNPYYKIVTILGYLSIGVFFLHAITWLVKGIPMGFTPWFCLAVGTYGVVVYKSPKE